MTRKRLSGTGAMEVQLVYILKKNGFTVIKVMCAESNLVLITVSNTNRHCINADR